MQNEIDPLEAEIHSADIVLDTSQPLGKGAYKIVYKGKCRHKPVAVGILLEQNLTIDQQNSLEREIKIMKNNPHPNIVLYMGISLFPNVKIITELLHGDVEKLLREQGRAMTVYERLLLAKDAALGMNWLHKRTPAIIHRDLKTANLLYLKVDKNVYQVKVSDFGLSDIKQSPTTMLRDINLIKGSPLYRAPEILLGNPFDEQSDVYSFGMCLWEIYTCDILFEKHRRNTYEHFKSAILSNERPPIPSDSLFSLHTLLHDCWAVNARQRPNFGTINDRLDAVLVEIAIEDLQGRIFWSTYFSHEKSVEWSQFSKDFYRFLNLVYPTPDSNQEDLFRLKCLYYLLTTVDSNQIEIQKFGRLFNWFGPLDQKFLTKLVQICSQPWFHGDIDARAAQEKLLNASPGTFLVRFSASCPGSFAISRVHPCGEITHVKILRTIEGAFFLDGKPNDVFLSLIDLLEGSAPSLNLERPCLGSLFSLILAGKEVVYPYEDTSRLPVLNSNAQMNF